MLRITLAVLLFGTPTLLHAQTPTQKVQARLAELLAPSGLQGGNVQNKPIAMPDTQRVGNPPTVHLPSDVTPPSVQAGPPAPAPRGAKDESPLTALQPDAKPTQRVNMPTKPLTRLPAAELPPTTSLPYLNKQVKDRAAVTDMTLETSVNAILRPITPSRAGKAPFERYTIPDPFEHEAVGRFRQPPAEDVHGPVVPIRVPRR